MLVMSVGAIVAVSIRGRVEPDSKRAHEWLSIPSSSRVLTQLDGVVGSATAVGGSVHCPTPYAPAAGQAC